MSLISWLFGRRTTQYGGIAGDDSFECEVVGESKYQDALDRICGGKTEEGHELDCDALLIPEPDNPYDRNAIAVYIQREKVGYLSRDYAATVDYVFRMRGLGGATVKAVIVGGWRRSESDEGHYGVRLDMPTE